MRRARENRTALVGWLADPTSHGEEDPIPRHAAACDAIAARLRVAGCVFADEEARLLVEAARTPADLPDMVDRRVAGQPLEHILGRVDFCGLRITVHPGVFVPRRRTELLVRTAVALAAPGATVVDLACGCGAVGGALATLVPGIALHCVDVDPVAVACARRNLADLGLADLGRGVPGTATAPLPYVYTGDLFDPLPARLRGHVDVLVANVPYVPTGVIGLLPPEAREHEPRVALDGGADGLDLVRRVAAGAGDWLSPTGGLALETGEGQLDAAVAVLRDAGLTPAVVHDEELSASVVTGRQ